METIKKEHEKPSDITDVSDVKKKVCVPSKTYSTMESVYTNNVRKKQYNVRLPSYQIEFLQKLPKGEASDFIRQALDEKIKHQTTAKCIYKDHSAIHSHHDTHPEIVSETSETSDNPKTIHLSPEQIEVLEKGDYADQIEQFFGKAEADRWRKENLVR